MPKKLNTDNLLVKIVVKYIIISCFSNSVFENCDGTQIVCGLEIMLKLGLLTSYPEDLLLL